MGFHKDILEWYKRKHRQLPWRSTKNPYKIWLSEIILQQTRINQGIAYYLKFINIFSEIKDLANANEEDVLKLWEGLGYYSRAKNLHKTAKFISNELNGVFPKKYSEIIKLYGIGPYTAAAISSICFNEKRAVVDGNVYRVLSRIYNVYTPINSSKGIKQFQSIANNLIETENPGDYNQGLMDLGATICLPKYPKCKICPVKKMCQSKLHKTSHLLPIKNKNKKSINRQISYLFIEGGEKFYMKKRSENDIWKSLYDFPTIGDTLKNKDIDIAIKQKVTEILNHSQFEKLNTHKMSHNLTHQKLNISITHLKTKFLQKHKKYILMTKKELINTPLPKPIKLFFKEQAKLVDIAK